MVGALGDTRESGTAYGNGDSCAGLDNGITTPWAETCGEDRKREVPHCVARPLTKDDYDIAEGIELQVEMRKT